MPATFDFIRLAALVIDRVQPVLPDGLMLKPADGGELESRRARRQAVFGGLAPGHLPPSSADRGQDGCFVLSYRDCAGRTLFRMAPHESGDLVGLVDHLRVRLRQLADEASESSTESHDASAALEGAQIRLWFGRCPPDLPDDQLRRLLPELTPIALGEFVRSDRP